MSSAGVTTLRKTGCRMIHNHKQVNTQNQNQATQEIQNRNQNNHIKLMLRITDIKHGLASNNLNIKANEGKIIHSSSVSTSLRTQELVLGTRPGWGRIPVYNRASCTHIHTLYTIQGPIHLPACFCSTKPENLQETHRYNM